MIVLRTLALGLACATLGFAGGVLSATHPAQVEAAPDPQEMAALGWMGSHGVPRSTAEGYWRAIKRHCDGLDPILVVALMGVESDYDPTATSPKGYHGLLQTRPRVSQPELQIAHGCYWLRAHLAEAGGDLEKGIGSYMGGAKIDNVRAVMDYRAMRG